MVFNWPVIRQIFLSKVLIYLQKEGLELRGLSEIASGLFLTNFIFLFIMQAMGSITPKASKSIRITVVITGNKTVRYKLVVVVGWSVVDW